MLNSYRIYKRLETSEQKLVRLSQKEIGYTLVDFALVLYKLSGYPLTDILNWIKKHPKLSQKAIKSLQKGFIPKSLSPDKKIRILEFHGFIPLEDLSRHTLKEGFAYITSNMSLNDKIYIFPERFYDDYKNKDKARNWQEVFESFCLPGLIRIYYSFEYKYLKNYADRKSKT